MMIMMWVMINIIMVILMVMMIEMTLGDKQMLTLFARPVFADQKIGGPLNIFGLSWVRVPIVFLEMACFGMNYHIWFENIQNDS